MKFFEARDHWKTVWYVLVAFHIFSVMAIAAPGRLDYTLGLNIVDGENAQIKVVEVQQDGKLIVAGFFRIANESRRDIVRLNTNNTLDSTFNAGTALATNGGLILAVKVQPDGKLLVGGTFNNFNGNFVERLIRLNSDGSVDPTFSLTGLNVTFVFDIDMQSTGKILISALNNAGTSFIARFSSVGAFDATFSFPFFGGSGFRMDVTADDKVVLSGVFTYTVNQLPGKNLARLGADGPLDPTFTSNVSSTAFPILDVQELAGGRALIWGNFDTVNGLTRRGVAIVNGDGSTYTQFDPSVIQNESILAAEFQADGKLIIAGENFTRTNTDLRGNILRLNADGSLDNTFSQGRGANGAIRVLRLRGANRLVLAGDFFRYDGVPRKFIAQIHV
jgi:uncharacterized delta-60 repeat protein